MRPFILGKMLFLFMILPIRDSEGDFMPRVRQYSSSNGLSFSLPI